MRLTSAIWSIKPRNTSLVENISESLAMSLLMSSRIFQLADTSLWRQLNRVIRLVNSFVLVMIGNQSTVLVAAILRFLKNSKNILVLLLNPKLKLHIVFMIHLSSFLAISFKKILTRQKKNWKVYLLPKTLSIKFTIQLLTVRMIQTPCESSLIN